VSAPPAIALNLRVPKNSASPSFIPVFARTPTAMAVAALEGEMLCATSLVMDTVRASTSLSRSIGADVNTPDAPHGSRARCTASSTA